MVPLKISVFGWRWGEFFYILITSVQPRIRLLRSFDERHHAYLGYVLHLSGVAFEDSKEFSVAVGKAAHQKHAFCIDMEVGGMAAHVADQRLEVAEFYKASGIRVEKLPTVSANLGPPFSGVPPDLETYRSRGHRRLDARTFDSKCLQCMWGCRMPVEMIVDQWNPGNKRFRLETFCYGPKSCKFYRAGANRKVPGRQGMTSTEENWVDDDTIAHRAEDE